MKSFVLILFVTIGQLVAQDKFKYVNEFPDTAAFIGELKRFCNLTDRIAFPKREAITARSKFKSYKSSDSCLLVEYDFGEGSMASYPWKYQFIFSMSGKLLRKFWGIRWDMVNVFNGDPCLLIVNSTASGNGYHELFYVNKDSLISVFNSNNSCPQTYSTRDNDPNELNIKMIDVNRDGLKDIVFDGMLITLKDRYFDEKYPGNKTTIPIEMIFLCNPSNMAFEPKENYKLKYKPNSKYCE